MLEIEENEKILKEILEKLNEIKKSIKLDNLRSNLKKLEEETRSENFWINNNNSSTVLMKIKNLQRKIDLFENIESDINNLNELNALIKLEFDDNLLKEIQDSIKVLIERVDKLEIETLFSGKYDFNNAIITMHPGAGGTEAQDWVEMLYRMYSKWAITNDYKVKELDYLAGDEAGIKSVTFLVSGDYAYGYLKGEMGVHRLVRISPFDSGGRRHTSFASVEVLPEITNDSEININSDDLRIDTYRASGAGRTTYK